MAAFASPDPCSVALDPQADDPSPSWCHTFLLRRARQRGAHTDLIKSSAIKIAESQKLLAEVDALLRR
jgi:hypothetical protein